MISKLKSRTLGTVILQSLWLSVALLARCTTATAAASLPTSTTPSSSAPHLTRRQTLDSISPTPDFATDVKSTVATVTTFVIIVWVVSLLGSLCVLCTIGYCILSYTRRQKEKSRMAKERHQMEMEAWRQQQHVYGVAAPGGPQVQRPQPAYAGGNGYQPQQQPGQQPQGYGRESEWSNSVSR